LGKPQRRPNADARTSAAAGGNNIRSCRRHGDAARWFVSGWMLGHASLMDRRMLTYVDKCLAVPCSETPPIRSVLWVGARQLGGS
jgi:hypothetical protein